MRAKRTSWAGTSLIGDLQKLDVQLDDSETMTNTISNLPEEYQKIEEIIEDELDDDYNPLTIERIHDNLSVK